MGESYYTNYIPIIHKRIEQAGIRLAGILNTLAAEGYFKGLVNTHDNSNNLAKVLATNVTQGIYKTINVKDAANFIGQDVSVTAKVYGVKDFVSMVLVNLGAPYPNSPLTVVLRGEAKTLSSKIDGKIITVNGKIIDYKGNPEIVVTNTTEIIIKL